MVLFLSVSASILTNPYMFKILSRVPLFRTCCSRVGEIIYTRNKNQHLCNQRCDNIDEDLPDRIVNPDMYQPLLYDNNNGVTISHHLERADKSSEDLPHRIVNPNMYQPLLPATNSGEGNSHSACQQ